MPYTTVATNDVLTASQINANYRDQVISTVTSGTRPSGTEGQVIYETDTDKFLAYTGAAWVEIQKLGAANTYTPSITPSGGGAFIGTGATQSGRYFRFGNLIVGQIRIVWGTSMTPGTGSYAISTPVTLVTSLSTATVGTARLFDSSASAMAITSLYVATSTTFQMVYPATWPSGTLTTVGAAAPWTWAVSDELNLEFICEAA